MATIALVLAVVALVLSILNHRGSGSVVVQPTAVDLTDLRRRISELDDRWAELKRWLGTQNFGGDKQAHRAWCEDVSRAICHLETWARAVGGTAEDQDHADFPIEQNRLLCGPGGGGSGSPPPAPGI